MFVDPIADIAVLGQPDDQAFSDQADAYDELVGKMEPWTIADAPRMGSESRTIGDIQVERPMPGVAPARVLSLKGKLLEGRVERRGSWLTFEPQKHFVGGMSGSPIIDANGAAIGVVPVERSSPVIADSLSAWLVRSILAAAPNVHPVP